MMAIADLPAPGGPEAIVPGRAPIPAPGRGEALIRVAAAGVNRPDVLQRIGRYAPPPGVSPVLGLEVAGEIAAVGDDCPRWRPGDLVCALLAGGGYAEWAVAPAEQILPWPAGLSAAEAAGTPETYFTVWTNVFQRGRLAPGETLLVHGGTSGIGTTAIQLAKAFGARVIATAGGPEKVAACLALGADRAIDHRAEDFVAATLDATAGRGADVILDMVGGPYVARNLACLALEGRLVQIAFLQGTKVELDLGPLMVKRQTLTGSTLRPRTPAEKGLIAAELEAKVWPLIAQGVVRPRVHATFPLAQAADAHRMLEAGSHIGKIVLTM